jgi:hypothetical protein
MDKTAVFLILILLISSCKEKADNPPAGSKIYFSGLTQTDYNGWPITVDSTDWKTGDTWVKQETDLFTTIYQTDCTQGFDYIIRQYPNPCDGIFTLSFGKPVSTRLELRLVDKNFHLLFSNDSILGNAVQLDSKSFGIKDTLRLYYKFIENNCEFKGHGDILVK